MIDNALAAGVREVRSFFDVGNYLDALDACAALLAHQPDSAEALLLLGLISFELDEMQKALLLLNQAVETAPHVREYADALACVNAQLGNDSDALYFAKLAVISQPHSLGEALLPEEYSKFFESIRSSKRHLFRNRAQRRLKNGDAAEAFRYCEKQLELTPKDIDAWRLLAKSALELGHIERVLYATEFLRENDKLFATDHDILARTLARVGRFDEAERAHLDAIDAAPNDPSFSQHRICTLAARYGTTDGHVARENSAWAKQHTHVGTAGENYRPLGQDHDRPLRVAYIGGELHLGSLADLLTPILAWHNPKQVEAYCYAANAYQDIASENLMGQSVRWTNIHGTDPTTVGEILRRDEIDIAVDLSGHGPNSQLQMFAQRPGPICVSWLGTAMPAGAGFDYMLTCETLTPSSEATGETSETLYRLPATHLAHRPLNTSREITSLPALSQPHLMLGVMAPLAHLGEECIQDWASILDRVPNGRIVIANLERFGDDAVNRIHEMATTAGIRDRVDVAGLESPDPQGYGFFEYFDVLLDPQPNSQFLETCRALWMGVPVLALNGDGYSGRQAAAALAAAGREEWIFETNEARADGLADLVSDLGQLADLRASLRDSVAPTPLYDVAGFARALEEAYRAMSPNCPPPCRAIKHPS